MTTNNNNNNTEEDKDNTLFDLKKFMQRKSYKSTPSILCFPTFFNCSIFSILNQYIYIYYSSILLPQKDESICSSISKSNSFYYQMSTFFKILPNLIKLIIVNNDNIHFRNYDEIIRDLMHMIKTQTFSDEKRPFLYLEWYLKDDASIEAYQRALYDANVQYHNNNNNKDDDLSSLHPKQHSQNYVIKGAMPTNIWGPIYWNVFHSLPENALIIKNSRNSMVDEETILSILYYMISLLPILVPCPYCRSHYYKCITPSQLLSPNFPTIESYIAIYSVIHQKVSLHKMGGI